MKNLKNKFAAIALAGFLMTGTTFAAPGLLMSDATGEQNDNTPTTSTTENAKPGILVTGLTVIVYNGFAGLLMSD